MDWTKQQLTLCFKIFMNQQIWFAKATMLSGQSLSCLHTTDEQHMITVGCCRLFEFSLLTMRSSLHVKLGTNAAHLTNFVVFAATESHPRQRHAGFHQSHLCSQPCTVPLATRTSCLTTQLQDARQSKQLDSHCNHGSDSTSSWHLPLSAATGVGIPCGTSCCVLL